MSDNFEKNQSENGYKPNWFSTPEDILTEETTKETTEENTVQIDSVPAEDESEETVILSAEPEEVPVEAEEDDAVSVEAEATESKQPETARPEWTAPRQSEAARPEWTAARQSEASNTGWTASRQPEASNTGWTAPRQPEASNTGWAAPRQPEAARPEWTASRQPEAARTEWTAPRQPETSGAGWTAPRQPEAARPEWTAQRQEGQRTIYQRTMPQNPKEAVKKEAESVKTDSTYAYTFREPTSKTDGAKKPEASNKKKKSSGILKKLAVCSLMAVVFGVIAGGVFLGVSYAGGSLLGINNQAESSESNEPKVERVKPIEEIADEPVVESDANVATPSTTTGELTVAQVAERCMPAMVAITNISITEVPNFFGWGSQNYESTSSGSGIIVGQTEEELLIATNNHVVSGATTLTVGFIDDSLVEAMIKGTDPENDLAVVSVKLSDIPAETLEQIKVIELGDSDDLAVGDQVVAIGNALGYGQSVSSGWVSALNREVIIDNMTLNLIQTDAAINPGNSGGALLNMKGELIAINESKYADTMVEGMGYAIPISTATPILSELMSKTTRYKVDEEQASYLGITCKDFSADVASMYSMPSGVFVDSVEENGPAALAGIKKGDIITEFDGTRVSSSAELISQLEYYAAGETVEFTICRAHEGNFVEQVVQVTLGARSDSSYINEGIE